MIGENVCKISKNGNSKIQIYEARHIYCLVGHEILNKTVYFVKHSFLEDHVMNMPSIFKLQCLI